MARKRSSSPWKKRIAYLITLLVTGSGAGVGSWQLRDHPLLQRLVLGIRDSAIQGKAPKDAIRDGLTSLLDGGDADKEGGIYEVKIADVRVEESLFKPGQDIDLQVSVVKFGPDDKPTVIWDSQTYGERRAVVGKDPLTATWADRPFQLAWAPGERVTVEIWDRHGYWDKHWLQMESPESNDRFPLHSGPHRLDVVAARKKPGAPEASKITLESQRVGNLPNVASRSGRHEGGTSAVAERPVTVR